MDLLRDIFQKHPGKIIGGFLGLIFGLLAIKYGLIKTLFIAACAVLGYYLGKRLDEHVGLKDIFTNLFKER